MSVADGFNQYFIGYQIKTISMTTANLKDAHREYCICLNNLVDLKFLAKSK